MSVGYLRSKVVFRPRNLSQVPEKIPETIFFPSAFYYYLTPLKERIPAPYQTGTPQEKELSLQIWYSMKSNEIFPLETVYAKSHPEQIGTPEIQNLERTGSELALSMKMAIRQIPQGIDNLYDERLLFLLGQMKNSTMDRILSDFYRFPLAPSADCFEAAGILEQFVRNGDPEPIRKYFSNRGVRHLVNQGGTEHLYGQYPVYYLFFLMTRYACYPMNQNQLILAELRGKTKFSSPAQILIDAVFDYEIYNLEGLVSLIKRVMTEGPISVGKDLKTNYSGWPRWADEYLKNLEIEPIPISNFSEPPSSLAQKLYTWSDLQIEKLAELLNIELPIREEYPTRIAYLESLAITISKLESNLISSKV